MSIGYFKFPWLLSEVLNVKPSPLLLALGGVSVTILAIAYPLSLYPVQKASDSWCPEIVDIYKKDRMINFALLFWGLLALISFLLSGTDIPRGKMVFTLIPFGVFLEPHSVFMKKGMVFSIFLFWTMSLDILREYYQHVCVLLNPSTAISLVKSKVKYKMGIYFCLANSVSFLQALFSKDPKQTQFYKLEYYTVHSEHVNFMCYWLDILFEMILKFIANNDIRLARMTLRSVCEIIKYYLDARRDCVLIRPWVGMPVLQTDIDDFLEYVYGKLRQLNKKALSANEEEISLLVLDVYRFVAKEVVNIHLGGFYKDSDELAFRPLVYFFERVKDAQLVNLNEVVLQGVNRSSKMICSFPKKVAVTSTYNLFIDSSVDIVFYFFKQKPPGVGNRVLGEMMKVTHHFFDIKDPRFLEKLAHLFLRIAPVVSFVLLQNKNLGDVALNSDMSEVYSLNSTYSVFYFLRKASPLLKKEGDDFHVNSYYEFFDISHQISEHLQVLGTFNFSNDTLLLSEILDLLKYLNRLLIGLMSEENLCPSEMLEGEVKRYISLFSMFLNDDPNVNFLHAPEACDAVAYLAIQAIRGRFLYEKIVSDCIKVIRFIVCNYVDAWGWLYIEDLASLLVFFCHIRLACLINPNQNAKLICEIGDALVFFLENEKGAGLKDCFEKKMVRFESRVKKEDRRSMRDSAEDLLRIFLKENKP